MDSAVVLGYAVLIGTGVLCIASIIRASVRARRLRRLEKEREWRKAIRQALERMEKL